MGHKQRLRAGRQEARNHDPENADDFGVDVVDAPVDAFGVPIDTDAVQTRATPDQEPEDDEPIEVLKRQFQELEAERDRERHRASDLEARNREHEATISQRAGSELANHKAVLEQAYAAEELKKADAKRRAAAAMAKGDFDGVADAQDEMAQSHAVMMRYSDAYQQIEAQQKAPKQVQQPRQVDEFEAAIAKMEPRVAAWAREHKDDVTKPDRQRLAIAADGMATARGYAPGSDAYLDYLDEAMGYYEPEGKTMETPQPKPAPRQAQQQTGRRAPAAPPTRTSGSTAGGRRRVTLTEDDKRQARGYGVTDEEYASWKLKSDAHPNIENNGSRLHAKFVSA